MNEGTLELIRQAQQGDASALAGLLREHYNFLFKYLIKATMDPSLAEDLVQDTMVRAMEKIGNYNGTSAFSSWLITIATRLYIDRKRRWKRNLSGCAKNGERRPYAGGSKAAIWSGAKCSMPCHGCRCPSVLLYC